jgi:hypothetical protein
MDDLTPRCRNRSSTWSRERCDGAAAVQAYRGTSEPPSVRLVVASTPEFKGVLPAWRVDFLTAKRPASMLPRIVVGSSL